MLILNLLSNPILFIGFILAIAVAISVHESAHAWMANRLGDPTAKLSGRISLNPIAHLDPMGTIFLFLAGFGWGKPVPVNSNNFKNPKTDELKVALAGPISNFVTALTFALIARFIPLPYIIVSMLIIIIQINIILMVFNLLPIPPLDGSNILRVFISNQSWITLQQFATPLLFVFIIFIFSTPYITNLITYLTDFFMSILLGNKIAVF